MARGCLNRQERSERHEGETSQTKFVVNRFIGLRTRRTLREPHEGGYYEPLATQGSAQTVGQEMARGSMVGRVMERARRCEKESEGQGRDLGVTFARLVAAACTRTPLLVEQFLSSLLGGCLRLAGPANRRRAARRSQQDEQRQRNTKHFSPAPAGPQGEASRDLFGWRCHAWKEAKLSNPKGARKALIHGSVAIIGKIGGKDQPRNCLLCSLNSEYDK
jgi:hypothetical protein